MSEAELDAVEMEPNNTQVDLVLAHKRVAVEVVAMVVVVAVAAPWVQEFAGYVVFKNLKSFIKKI